MKTLEDFKGTREPVDWAESKKTLRIYKTSDELYIAKCGLPTDEDRANFKLFANSYKLLEAADNLMKHIKSCGEPYANRVEVVELEQAIQDCL